jgi:hypothetical protein
MAKMNPGMRMLMMTKAAQGDRMMEPEMRRKRDPRGRYMEDQGEPMMGAYRPWPDPHMPPYLNGAEDDRRMTAAPMRGRNVVNIRDYQDRRIGFAGHDKHSKHHRLDEETARDWVENMHNADPEHPTGAKWPMESVKPFAVKKGYTTPEEQLEFWAVMNMMHSDYCEVAKKHGVSNADFYADMAKAWMDDKDAVEGKTAAYIECCTK